MANYLFLNQSQVFSGLGTLTYVVPTGTVTQGYNVQVQVTFPDADPVNANWTDDVAGAGSGNNRLAYMGAGSAYGLGSGTGGGDQGFVLGDRGLGAQGTGHGGVGQGFGTANNYPQPIAAGSDITVNSPIKSSLSIVVNKNAVAQYTSTAPVNFQGALQFKTSLPGVAAGDTITVVFSSSASVDNQLNAIISNTSISQGLL